MFCLICQMKRTLKPEHTNKHLDALMLFLSTQTDNISSHRISDVKMINHDMISYLMKTVFTYNLVAVDHFFIKWLLFTGSNVVILWLYVINLM